MSHIVCQHNEQYNIYSTVMDDFLFKESIDEDTLYKYWKEEYGRSSLYQFNEIIMPRTKETGTSSRAHNNLKELLKENRVGDNEESLSYDECIARFFS